MGEPEHVCAILEDGRGRLLLQLRPATARHAPDQLTCFGGKREAGETAEAALDRELAEELGWVPARAEPAVDLVAGPRWIARFYRADLPEGTILRVETGFHAIRAPIASLAGLPITPWHVQVLAAWRAGIPRVEAVIARPASPLATGPRG